MEMLQGFTLLECDALVELGPTRLVDNLVGQMPWLAMHVGNVGVGEKKAAASIATVCNLLQQPDLGQVFRNYADDTYTDANEFLDDFARLFCASNLKGHEIRALTFLCETRFEGLYCLSIARSWCSCCTCCVSCKRLIVHPLTSNVQGPRSYTCPRCRRHGL